MASPGKKAFPLRVNPQVWAALERLAQADLRSVNAQIEFMLRDGLKRRGVNIEPAPGPVEKNLHPDHLPTSKQ